MLLGQLSSSLKDVAIVCLIAPAVAAVRAIPKCAARHFSRQDISACHWEPQHCRARPSTTKVQLCFKTRAGKNECSMALVRTNPRANRWRACLQVAVESKSKTKQPGTNQES